MTGSGEEVLLLGLRTCWMVYCRVVREGAEGLADHV